MKRSILKLSSLALAALLLMSLFISCGEQIYGHAELRIDLPSDYSEYEAQGFDSSYVSGTSIVGILRISFEAGLTQGIADTYMPREFAEFYLEKLGRDATVEMLGDAAYYQYTDYGETENYYYLSAFYRSKYAYFVILFACPEDEFKTQQPAFFEYAKSVVFIK